jgi:deoxycytidine triphosphate deaminase
VNIEMLSNEDIKKELGKNIYIYPLNVDNLKGNTINLSASQYAWSLKKECSIVTDNEISIPPNDTALIYTEETIYVTKKIGGTYHSKVKLVSKGLGHIGTTLDPEYIGPSLIAVHNHSDKKIIIKVGDTFVSLVLYYLHSPIPAKMHNNAPGQKEVLSGLKDTDDAEVWLDSDWCSVPEKLKQKMLESNSYKDMYQKKERLFTKRFKYLKTAGKYCIVLLICFIAKSAFDYFNVHWSLEYPDYVFFTPVLGFLLGIVGADLNKYF